MKLIALATALAVGGTAIAQETPTTTTTVQDQTTTTMTTSTPMDQSTTTGTTGAGTTEAPTTTGDPATSPETTTAPTGAPTGATASSAMEDPRGGYMPSAPALSGTPMPGQQVIFRQSQTPSEAFPAPAPLQSYPICKRGQFDNCMQRGGR